jgi:hypothetical protein
MTPYEFYLDFMRRLTLPHALPAAPPDVERFLTYFADRGISTAMIAESGAIPLTQHPTNEERDAFRAAFGEARLRDKTNEPNKICDGILFPTPGDAKEYGSHGVARGFVYSESYRTYCASVSKDLPKFLNPKHVKTTCRPYILPSEVERLRKQTTTIHIIEGRPKALKLIQDFREAGLTAENAVIGIDGVDMLIPAPEMQKFPWKNRNIVLWWDADSLDKATVARSEVRATAFLYAKGARSVKSCFWNPKRGKGYDDMSVNEARKGYPPAVNLPPLLHKAKDVFRKHTEAEDDAQRMTIELACEAVASVPGLTKNDRKILLAKLERAYKPLGFSASDINDMFDGIFQREEAERTQKTIEQNAKIVQQAFGIPYTPTLPEQFSIENGMLTHQFTPICRPFIIKKYISTDDATRRDSYLLAFADGREIELPSDEFSNCHTIAKLFNQNQELLHDATAKMAQKYIAQFWHRNRYTEHAIPVVVKHDNTGWNGEGKFRLPTLDAGNEFDGYIKEAFALEGDADAQFAFFRELFQTHNAGLIALCGMASPCVGLFGIPNITVLLTGRGGEGKTTAPLAALSAYGNRKKLKFSMDTSKTGKEIVCSMFKDLPVLLDEANTSGADASKIAEFFISTIYGWESGTGKARGTTNITLRGMSNYSGLLFMTAERSLAAILSAIKGVTIGGAYRRVLEIPISGRFPLWAFEPDQKKPFFDTLYQNMSNHYGYVGAAWLTHLSDIATQDRIKTRYKAEMDAFGKTWKLEGMDNLICLLYGIMPEVESVMRLPVGAIRSRLKEYISFVLQHQQDQVNYQLRDTIERFKDCLEEFTAQYPRAFEGLTQKEEMLSPIYGAYQETTKKIATDVFETTFEIWLTSNGMEQLCQQYGFNKNDLLAELAEMKIAETKAESYKTESGAVKTRTSYTVVKYFAGRSWRAHHLTFSRTNDAGVNPKADAKAKQGELIKKPRDMPD